MRRCRLQGELGRSVRTFSAERYFLTARALAIARTHSAIRRSFKQSVTRFPSSFGDLAQASGRAVQFSGVGAALETIEPIV